MTGYDNEPIFSCLQTFYAVDSLRYGTKCIIRVACESALAHGKQGNILIIDSTMVLISLSDTKKQASEPALPRHQYQRTSPFHASRKSITLGSLDAAISDLMPSVSTNILCKFQIGKKQHTDTCISWQSDSCIKRQVATRQHPFRLLSQQPRFAYCNLSTHFISFCMQTCSTGRASQGLPLMTSTTHRSLACVLGELTLVVIGARDVRRAGQILLVSAHGIEDPAPLAALIA